MGRKVKGTRRRHRWLKVRLDVSPVVHCPLCEKLGIIPIYR